MNFLSIALFLIFSEICLFIIVRLLRKDFQWLITTKDESPDLDSSGLKSFFLKSFDSSLGWVRKENTKGIEKGEKEITFYIDKYGSRTNPKSDKYIPTIACFGDSYAFCRQVDNDETWQYYLTESLKTGVFNFGVGNYGLDQALIRHKNIELPNSIDNVIMAVVPETICRIQSLWKHYLEFGNTFAFKPKFNLDDGVLKLIECKIQDEKDLRDYKKNLSFIKNNDRFYKEKFKKYQFRFPYLFSYLRNIIFNTKLFYFLIKRFLFRILGIENHEVEDKPFSCIMENNIKLSHKLYNEKFSKDLFNSLLNEFAKNAKSKGQKPIFILLPQLIDIRIIKKNKSNPYSDFINNLNISDMKIFDFTETFLKIENLNEYYVNDKYGGHMSKKGNLLIAEKLIKILTSIKTKDKNANHV